MKAHEHAISPGNGRASSLSSHVRCPGLAWARAVMSIAMAGALAAPRCPIRSIGRAHPAPPTLCAVCRAPIGASRRTDDAPIGARQTRRGIEGRRWGARCRPHPPHPSRPGPRWSRYPRSARCCPAGRTAGPAVRMPSIIALACVSEETSSQESQDFEQGCPFGLAVRAISYAGTMRTLTTARLTLESWRQRFEQDLFRLVRTGV